MMASPFFYVLNGLYNGERHLSAQRSGSEEPLRDGHYFLLPGEVDPSSGPYPSADDATEAYERAIGRSVEGVELRLSLRAGSEWRMTVIESYSEGESRTTELFVGSYGFACRKVASTMAEYDATIGGN